MTVKEILERMTSDSNATVNRVLHQLTRAIADQEKVQSIVSRVKIKGTWVDVKEVDLVLGQVYVIRRVFCHPSKIFDPCIAQWRQSGWDVIGGDPLPGNYGTVEILV